MGYIADQLVDQEMFGYEDEFPYKPRFKNRHIKLTPVEKKIASIRKEIAIDIKSGNSIQEARRKANLKYGKGWRDRGLIVNSDNQWSEEDLRDFK